MIVIKQNHSTATEHVKMEKQYTEKVRMNVVL